MKRTFSIVVILVVLMSALMTQTAYARSPKPIGPPDVCPYRINNIWIKSDNRVTTIVHPGDTIKLFVDADIYVRGTRVVPVLEIGKVRGLHLMKAFPLTGKIGIAYSRFRIPKDALLGAWIYTFRIGSKACNVEKTVHFTIQ